MQRPKLTARRPFSLNQKARRSPPRDRSPFLDDNGNTHRKLCFLPRSSRLPRNVESDQMNEAFELPRINSPDAFAGYSFPPFWGGGGGLAQTAAGIIPQSLTHQPQKTQCSSFPPGKPVDSSPRLAAFSAGRFGFGGESLGGAEVARQGKSPRQVRAFCYGMEWAGPVHLDTFRLKSAHAKTVDPFPGR